MNASANEASVGSNKSRKIWVDAVRGYAITLVVVGHVIQSASHGAFDFFVHPVFVFIYAFHMPLFMFISGFVSVNSLKRDFLIALISSRARTLLIPILSWSIMGSAVVYFVQVIYGKAFSGSEFVVTITRGILDPSSVLWFPWILFVSYLTAWVFVRLRQWTGTWALIIAIPIVWILPINNYFGLFQMKWLFPFFIAGLLISEYGMKIRKYENVITWFSILIFLVMLMFWKRDYSVYITHMEFNTSNSFDELLNYVFRYLIAFAGVAASVGIIRFISRRFKLSTLAKLGIASMGIYCLQTFLVMVLGNTPSPETHPKIYIFVYTPAMTVLIVAISYFFTTKVIERYKISRLLFLGGR